MKDNNEEFLITKIECEEPIWAIKLSPDNSIFIVGDDEGSLYTYNFPEGNLQDSFTAHSAEILDIAFSRDGKRLVSCSDGNNDIKLWKFVNGKLTFKVGRSFNHITEKLLFTPDNQNIVGSSKYYLRLYDMKNLNQIGRFNIVEDNYIDPIVFAPYGYYFASGSEEKDIKIWKFPSREFYKSFKDHSGAIISLIFSPDEKFLISGSKDKTIKIWDFPKGNMRKTLNGHDSGVPYVAISPDGKILVSSDNNIINFWDLPYGNLKYTIDKSCKDILFSLDGKYLVTNEKGIVIRDFLKLREKFI